MIRIISIEEGDHNMEPLDAASAVEATKAEDVNVYFMYRDPHPTVVEYRGSNVEQCCDTHPAMVIRFRGGNATFADNWSDDPKGEELAKSIMATRKENLQSMFERVEQWANSLKPIKEVS